MKNEILTNLENPVQLEQLYRSNRSAFKRAFNALSAELAGNPLAGFWQARLNVSRDEVSWGTTKDLAFVIVASLVAGLIAKLPAIFQMAEEPFFMRNAVFLVFPFLTAWFAWKNQLSTSKIIAIGVAVTGSAIFINVLPGDEHTDSFVLSCIHLAVFLWSVLGFAFVGTSVNDPEKRLGFLAYNGDLVVMTTLIMIAAGILSAVTNGLFSLIGLDIEQFYFQYVVIVGLPAAPILGTYLIRTNPQLVGKVSPVIARLFSPLVLAMLVIYLVAILYSGKDPYNDREFLLIFNILLVGVMAIIFFSVANQRSQVFVLLMLSLVTIIVNGIALSAIVFRISEWGITPNRTAVLGGNVLILVNLLLVTAQLYKVARKKAGISAVGNAIAAYLPVYAIWAAVVTFIFPFLFGFK